MDSEGLTEVQILAIAPQQLNCASIDKVGAPHRHQTSTGRRIAGDCDGRPFSGTHCCGCPFYGLQADHSERSSGERSSDGQFILYLSVLHHLTNDCQCSGSSPYYVHSEPAMPLRSRSNSALGWVDDAGSAAGFPTQRNPTILTTAAPGWRTHKRKARRVHVRGGINFRKDIIQGNFEMILRYYKKFI